MTARLGSNDSTHKLADKIVDLPDPPEWLTDEAV